jgi:hypothetical protein
MEDSNVAYFEVQPQNFQGQSEVHQKQFTLDS